MKCQSHECPCDPVGGFVWPGKPPQPACLLCILRANEVADALGFHLHVVALVFEVAEATEAVARMKNMEDAV